jgi:hypothetical protein
MTAAEQQRNVAITFAGDEQPVDLVDCSAVLVAIRPTDSLARKRAGKLDSLEARRWPGGRCGVSCAAAARRR